MWCSLAYNEILVADWLAVIHLTPITSHNSTETGICLSAHDVCIPFMHGQVRAKVTANQKLWQFLPLTLYLLSTFGIASHHLPCCPSVRQHHWLS